MHTICELASHAAASFVFTAAVAVVIAALVAWNVPTSGDPNTPPFDLQGLVLSAVAMGVLVLGVIEASVGASFYTSRLGATIPHLSAGDTVAAKASVGGALITSHALIKAGLVQAGHNLANSADGAFLHGRAFVAGGVTLVGVVVAALFLPARPRQAPPSTPAPDAVSLDILNSLPQAEQAEPA